MEEFLDHVTVVCQAHGVLMARYDCELSIAAQRLTVAATAAGVSDVEMAQRIVAEVEQRARTHHTAGAR